MLEMDEHVFVEIRETAVTCHVVVPDTSERKPARRLECEALTSSLGVNRVKTPELQNTFQNMVAQRSQDHYPNMLKFSPCRSFDSCQFSPVAPDRAGRQSDH